MKTTERITENLPSLPALSVDSSVTLNMFVILCSHYYHPSPEFFRFVKLKLNTQRTRTLRFPFLPSPWQSLSSCLSS